MTLLNLATPKVAELMDDLANPEATIDDRAAAYAVLHQVQLRINRALKAAKDELIVFMERGGIKELGPLSIKSSAVDPSYPANAPENWADSTIQDTLADLRRERTTRPYVREVPAHLEIDVAALAADVQMGVQAAIDLYRELNRKGWRTEQARRLSLAVREAKGTT